MFWEQLQAVTDFTLTQVDNKAWGGAAAQFIVNEANPLFVKELVDWMYENRSIIMGAIMVKANEALVTAQAEAKIEAQEIADKL